MLHNTTIKRITAWIAMVAVACVMLFSAIFIPNHLDHDCTGEDCPVCAVIMQCTNNIHNLVNIAFTATTILSVGLFFQKILQYAYTVFSDCSLISQKVRMNN